MRMTCWQNRVWEMLFGVDLSDLEEVDASMSLSELAHLQNRNNKYSFSASSFQQIPLQIPFVCWGFFYLCELANFSLK